MTGTIITSKIVKLFNHINSRFQRLILYALLSLTFKKLVLFCYMKFYKQTIKNQNFMQGFLLFTLVYLSFVYILHFESAVCWYLSADCLDQYKLWNAKKDSLQIKNVSKNCILQLLNSVINKSDSSDIKKFFFYLYKKAKKNLCL